jgi:hypothetical protein
MATRKPNLNGAAPAPPVDTTPDDIQVQVHGDKLVLVIPIGLVMTSLRARSIAGALNQAAAMLDAQQGKN